MSEYLWGPMLAGYLFLGGLAGGAYVIGALVDLFKGDDYEVLSKSGVYVSFVSIVLGLVLLILDLKRFQVDPLVILNAYRNFPGSIVSVGTWILTVFAVVSLMTALIWLFEGNQYARMILEIGGIVLGLSLCAYTGLLLAFARGSPFWSSPFLPWTFVISGTLTGLAVSTFMIPVLAVFLPKAFSDFRELYERKAKFTGILNHTQKYVAILIIVEMALVIIELATGHGQVETLLTGSLSLMFYTYLIAGLLVPLGISYYVGKLGREGPITFFSMSGSLLILVGGFLLRYTILTAGQIFH